MTKSSDHYQPVTPWEKKQAEEAREFRRELTERIRSIDAVIDYSAYGVNALREVEVSFGHRRGSKHWFTIRLKWAVLALLLGVGLPSSQKDSVMICPGSLKGGRNPGGARKIKENVQRLDCVILDFDKGDAPLEAVRRRLEELGLEGSAYTTFSHLKDATALAWEVTSFDVKSGEMKTSPTAFQKFSRTQLGIETGPIDRDQVTAEHAKAFMVEVQGYDASVLGDVWIKATNVVTKSKPRSPSTGSRDETKSSFLIGHLPIAKARLALLLDKSHERLPGETAEQYQKRWEEEVYLPAGRLIGFNFDESCATTERGHYALTSNAAGADVEPVFNYGRTLSMDEPSMLAHRSKLAEERNKQSKKRGARERQARRDTRKRYPDWSGFLAADAAAAHLPDVTDKRDNADSPLVAFPCPFVHEHSTSNDPSKHQCYAYNASAASKLPTVKCMSATCQDRPYGEFLDKLFEDEVQADPAFRLTEGSSMTGVYIPAHELDTKLHEINLTWAVARVGNRTRFLHENEEGEIELYDAKSMSAWFSNWSYYWIDEDGVEKSAAILPKWLAWQYRRQYRGMRFCPQPEGAPPGVFNTYFGFTVEPKKGSWKRLLAHIYRNVCRRNPEYFRFLIAWLAQLVQEPHIKPGTNIVLKGKEGVGKTKLFEWIAALFGRNAIVVSEAERITGRFNAHLENKLFLVAEEAFWAGDKAAEGKLKDLATGKSMSYERKGLDPYEGENYTRIAAASNEDWVVPASSGGRRWFVLEVGDECEKNHAYFAAIDKEMEEGGLAAMLHDLQRSPLLEQVNVRSAPVTPWLVEQRLHSYGNKKRWWRGVLLEGGFLNPDKDHFVELNEDRPTAIKRDDIYASAKQYFLGPKGVDPTPSEVGQFLSKMLGELEECRPRIEGQRVWCTIFPPLKELREKWRADSGETIVSPVQSAAAQPGNATEGTTYPSGFDGFDLSGDFVHGSVSAACEAGVTDGEELARVAERAAATLRKSPLSRARH